MKTAVKWLSVLVASNVIILAIFFIYPRAPPVNTNTDFDVTYEDPEGDVADGGGNPVGGHSDIDIIEIKSYKSEDDRYLIIELKVAGKIRNSKEVEYNIELEGEGADYYLEDDIYEWGEVYYYYSITYNNGVCKGHDDDNWGTDLLDTSIKNSDTLIIKVPLERLAKYRTFRMWCGADKDVDWDYSDSCPEDWGYDLNFIEPMAGTTVFNNCTINGTMDTEDDIFFTPVEVQIDSLVPNDWVSAESSNNWTNWSYIWNTQNYSDGEHTVYARAIIGGYYCYDRITLYVDQRAATKPRTAEAPTYQIGDKYQWRSTDPYMQDNDISNEKYEVIGLETISINGTDYDTYVFKTEIIFEGFWHSNYYKSTYNRTYWLRQSDLALIQDQMYIEYLEKDGEDEFIDGEIWVAQFEYPKGYTWFPVEVGKSWENLIIEKGFNRYPGNNTMMNYSSLDVECFHCLHTKNITVPAGTFEVFVIAYDWDFIWHSNMGEGDMPNIENESIWEDQLYYGGLIYYSPELGQIIKTDGYTARNRFFNWGELVGYKYGNKSFEYEAEENFFSKYEEGFSVLVFSLISVNTILVTTLFITTTELGKFSFFKAIAPFLAKRRKKRNYEHGFIKGSVRGVIYANPGENYSSIKKILELPNGTLTYYLKALEKEGMIRAERDGFLKRFYPAKGRTDDEVMEFTEVQKDIHDIIRNQPGIYQKDIQSKLGISQQKLNYHINLMVDARVIEVQREGKRSKCFVIDGAS
ncbi:winged helix-turn-helix transcriptional regulator [[Eubacterium] cellulosolvens]